MSVMVKNRPSLFKRNNYLIKEMIVFLHQTPSNNWHLLEILLIISLFFKQVLSTY